MAIAIILLKSELNQVFKIVCQTMHISMPDTLAYEWRHYLMKSASLRLTIKNKYQVENNGEYAQNSVLLSVKKICLDK